MKRQYLYFKLEHIHFTVIPTSYANILPVQNLFSFLTLNTHLHTV